MGIESYRVYIRYRAQVRKEQRVREEQASQKQRAREAQARKEQGVREAQGRKPEKKDTRAYECPSTLMKERREERLHPLLLKEGGLGGC